MNVPDDVERALRAQRVYEELDTLIQALGALKDAIAALVLADESPDDNLEAHGV